MSPESLSTTRGRMNRVILVFVLSFYSIHWILKQSLVMKYLDARSPLGNLSYLYFFSGPCLLCSCLLFFLCTFDFELGLLSPHVILSFDYPDQEQVFTKCLQMERRLSPSFTNNKSAVIKTKNMNKSFRILI